ncbi:serine hydrolase [Streptomyces sioyaensis]|uniref:serine hydrolase n=1 Tax=Streptomyces sioyaensis TaxID=67364 RepID=UPI003794BDDF
MAGESPDKSDKKQSSGETARSERDPRLSAFRREPDGPAKKQEAVAGEDARPQDDPETADGTKPAAKSAAKPKSKSKAETDAKPGAKSKAAVKPGAAAGAKAVEPSEAEAADPSEVSEEGKASEGAEASQGAAEGDGGGEGGDDRLRAAVAAWVASTDGDGAEGGDGGSEGDAAGSEESGPAAAGADADDAVEAAEGAAAKSEVKPEAEGAARPEVKAGETADGKTDGKAAAKAEPAAKADGKGAGKAEAVSEDGGEAEPAAASLPQQAKVVDQPTAVFKTVGPQKGKPSGAAGAAGKGDGKGAGDGDGGGESDAEEAPADDATRVFAIAKLKGKGAEAEVVDQATTAFKINPPAKSKDGAKGKPASGSKTDAKDKAEDKDKADAKDASDSDGKTDATKDGDAKTDAKTDGDAKKDAGGKTKGAPERDSERTSQFVALKSSDDGTAGKSLGKTAPRTPARTPDKAADKPWDEAADKAADKSSDKAAGKAAGSTADEVAEEPVQKSPEKPAAKAPGALPAAEPAKPATPPKQSGRTGAMPSAAEATGAAAPAALPESERTKQEPLPPLDLLAQLTNTPPPPQTPLRTVVRRFKIWTPLAVLLAIVFVVAQAVRPLPAPKLTVGASTAFTFKGGKLAMPWPDQGQAAAEVVGVGKLGTSGQEKPVPTASVAKVMTAYVLLRDHPLKKGQKGETITVDAQGEADSNKGDESRVPLKKGQQFTQYQMMQMLMIPSGNNVARQLARWDAAGSQAAFVKKMNDAAKKLGMTKTHYTDPSGLLQSTVSTAVDQLKLAEQVVKNDVFREVVRTENVQIDGLPEKIYNNNRLLTTMPDKVSGIKTGSSTPAGGTFMWSGYRNVGGKDQLLLGVTMDQHTNSPDPNAQLALVLNNTEKVITAARNALVSDTVVKKGQVVGYVDDGLGGETPVVATKDLSAVGWSGMKATFSMSDGGKSIPHTAKAGTEVGELTVGNGESTQKVPVALQKDLVEPAFGSKLVRIT